MMRATCRGLGYGITRQVSYAARQAPAVKATAQGGPPMPNRRTMELVIITVLLLHPVLAMAHTWANKHIATHDASTVGEIVSALT